MSRIAASTATRIVRPSIPKMAVFAGLLGCPVRVPVQSAALPLARYMSHLPSGPERRRLGLDARITRRDFVNGALVGAGAALLGGATSQVAAAPARARPTSPGEPA